MQRGDGAQWHRKKMQKQIVGRVREREREKEFIWSPGV